MERSERLTLGGVVDDLTLLSTRKGLQGAQLLDLHVLLALPIVRERALSPSDHDRAETLREVLALAVAEVELKDERHRKVARTLVGTDEAMQGRNLPDRYHGCGLDKNYYYDHRVEVLNALARWLLPAEMEGLDAATIERRERRASRARAKSTEYLESRGIAEDHELQRALSSEIARCEAGFNNGGAELALFGFVLLADLASSLEEEGAAIRALDLSEFCIALIDASPFDARDLTSLREFLFEELATDGRVETWFLDHLATPGKGERLLNDWQNWVAADGVAELREFLSLSSRRLASPQ